MASMAIWQLLWQKVSCYCLDFNLLSAVYALFPFVATLNGIIIGTVTALCVCVSDRKRYDKLIFVYQKTSVKLGVITFIK